MSSPKGLSADEIVDLQAKNQKEVDYVSHLVTELRVRIQTLDPSRERSHAETKLDECELWLTRCYRTLRLPS